MLSFVFWIGIGIVAIGVVARVVWSMLYYREYKSKGLTDISREAVMHKYRSVRFIILGVQLVGLGIAIAGLYM